MAWVFKEYYGRNKDRLNKARRERYKNDPEYRARVLETTRKMKKDKAAEHPGRVLRTLRGKQYQVFRIGAVADAVGVSVGHLRMWESDGVIPHPSFPGLHRVYTEHQVALIKNLVDALVGKTVEEQRALREEHRYIIKKGWKP